MKTKVIDTKKQELTLEVLKYTFGGDVYAGIEHAQTFYAPYPDKPQKPLLKKEHSAEDVKAYAKYLELYESGLKKYEEAKDHYRIIQSAVDSVIEGFIKDESGLNSVVPEQYRGKCWSKAWSDGHSSGYYQVYCDLLSIVEIFKK